MSNTNESQALKKIVKSLISSRYSPQKTDFESESGEYIEIPSQPENSNSEKIAIFIERSNKQLPGNPIVLFTHGDGESINDYLGYQDYFCPYGVSFCVMDYRGTGFSEGTLNTSGVYESEDVITVIKYLKYIGFEKVSFFGRSLGAKCGIYAAAQFPDLVCLAFDSGSIDIKGLTIYQVNKFDHIDKTLIEQLLPEACKIIKEKYGIDYEKIEEPYSAAEKITQPIFVIHGKNDYIVPIENSVKLMQLIKSQDKKFIKFDGGHNDFKRFKYFNQQFLFILHHNGIDISEEEFNH